MFPIAHGFNMASKCILVYISFFVTLLYFWSNNEREISSPFKRRDIRDTVKAGFHMIADRRSQLGLQSSAIIWKLLLRSSAILRSRSQTIAEDRTMFYLKAGFHMIADLIAICDPRSYGNQPLHTHRTHS